jgi:hypothetical protein
VYDMTIGDKNRKTRAKRCAYLTRRALRLIRKGHPKTLEETAALLIGLEEAGTGAFRAAYRIRGTDLLIKFPLKYRCESQETPGGSEVWHDKDGKNHTRMEMEKILALGKFPIMRKHIPHVYYFHSKNGVIVTRYYPKSTSMWVRSATSRLVSEMVKKYCGVTLGDLTPDNLRVKRYDCLIIADLGY